MGMLLKSAIGLGSVYIAMFAPAIRTADVRPPPTQRASG